MQAQAKTQVGKQVSTLLHVSNHETGITTSSTFWQSTHGTVQPMVMYHLSVMHMMVDNHDPHHEALNMHLQNTIKSLRLMAKACVKTKLFCLLKFLIKALMICMTIVLHLCVP